MLHNHCKIIAQILLEYDSNIVPERRGCIDAWMSMSRSVGGSQALEGQEMRAGGGAGGAGGGTLPPCRSLDPGAGGGGGAGRGAEGEVGEAEQGGGTGRTLVEGQGQLLLEGCFGGAEQGT